MGKSQQLVVVLSDDTLSNLLFCFFFLLNIYITPQLFFTTVATTISLFWEIKFNVVCYSPAGKGLRL